MDGKVILDIDPLSGTALRLLNNVGPIEGLWGYKLGDKILQAGMENVLYSLKKKRKVFVDLKHYDTADRIARIVAKYAELGEYAPQFLTISGDAGPQVMEAAVRERGNINIIVTGPLSNWDDEYCLDIYSITAAGKMLRIFNRAHDAGAQGVTCPAWLLSEEDIRLDFQSLKETFSVIATGIRSDGIPSKNHKFPRTACFALEHGATHVVVGSEVTDHPGEGMVERLKKFIAEARPTTL